MNGYHQNVPYAFAIRWCLYGKAQGQENSTEAFVEPVPAYNFDARLGHNFVNPRRADRSVAIWFGTFYQRIKADTDGRIPISNLFPDVTPEQADEIRESLDEWVESLPSAQKQLCDRCFKKSMTI